ncbi:hypothetical protein GCM10010277_80210 [Streptomyces longisporoflavus]|nr:hypothetical protein GCM10010277_80210 [Streptomyces longisporoflavus]
MCGGGPGAGWRVAVLWLVRLGAEVSPGAGFRVSGQGCPDGGGRPVLSEVFEDGGAEGDVPWGACWGGIGRMA